jgi:hypothetical protein
LALFALNCIPDIWPQPIADLTAIWSDRAELLLRVLAEFPTEFGRVVRMPLSQRTLLKSELHRSCTVGVEYLFNRHFEGRRLFEIYKTICQDIIGIVSTVLGQETTPSLRNAAVDCVEQWLKLPGVSLDDWRQLLVIVLKNVNGDR